MTITEYNMKITKSNEEIKKWLVSEINKGKQFYSNEKIENYKKIILIISGKNSDGKDLFSLALWILALFNDVKSKINSNENTNVNNQSLVEELEMLRCILQLLPILLVGDFFEYEHKKQTVKQLIENIKSFAFDPDDIESKEAIEIMFDTIKQLESI